MEAEQRSSARVSLQQTQTQQQQRTHNNSTHRQRFSTEARARPWSEDLPLEVPDQEFPATRKIQDMDYIPLDPSTAPVILLLTPDGPVRPSPRIRSRSRHHAATCAFRGQDLDRFLRGAFVPQWIQKAAAYFRWQTHALAFLTHWTTDTLSLQGRQIAEWVPTISSAEAVRMEMLDQATALPARLTHTECDNAGQRFVWPVFSLSKHPSGPGLGLESPGNVLASFAQDREDPAASATDAAPVARIEVPVELLFLSARSRLAAEKIATQERPAHSDSCAPASENHHTLDPTTDTNEPNTPSATRTSKEPHVHGDRHFGRSSKLLNSPCTPSAPPPAPPRPFPCLETTSLLAITPLFCPPVLHTTARRPANGRPDRASKTMWRPTPQAN